MRKVTVDISISADEYVKQYQFSNAVVSTYCRDGRSVRFPANILQRFITHAGVKGSFSIEFDSSGKFTQIHKL
ncbi:DUF2835 domain-containing protein [uncultured Oceanicoccus sp.]|uniref:DUF2835 domain-containing protein n=1 Tax=uncultured Oceanicoccus sp. TaxID=1706381 RepID=UPI0030D73177